MTPDETSTASAVDAEGLMREVAEAELAIEDAGRRLSEAVVVATKLGAEPNVVVALESAARTLIAARRQLHQDAYLRSDQQRML